MKPIPAHDTKVGDYVRECINGWACPACLSKGVGQVSRVRDDGAIDVRMPSLRYAGMMTHKGVRSWVRLRDREQERMDGDKMKFR